MNTFHQEALRRHYNHANHKMALFMDYSYRGKDENYPNALTGYIHNRYGFIKAIDLPKKNHNAFLAKNKNDLKYNSSYDWLIPVYQKLLNVKGYSQIALKVTDEDFIDAWYNHAICLIEDINNDIEGDIRYLLYSHNKFLASNIYCIKIDEKYTLYCQDADYDKLLGYINSTGLKDTVNLTTDISFLENNKYDIIMAF